MGIISTAVAVHVGTRGIRKALDTRVSPDRFNRVQAAVAPFVDWFDGLADPDAYAYAASILGVSRGSRYADREALVSYHAARVW